MWYLSKTKCSVINSTGLMLDDDRIKVLCFKPKNLGVSEGSQHSLGGRVARACSKAGRMPRYTCKHRNLKNSA